MVSKQTTCPRCGSTNIESYEDLGFIKCKECSYDELAPEPLPHGIRKSQREKGRYSPYKSGGGARSITKKR
jgi:tRNA(Ile2) C34 agmatinyltransferase TiaS